MNPQSNLPPSASKKNWTILNSSRTDKGHVTREDQSQLIYKKGESVDTITKSKAKGNLAWLTTKAIVLIGMSASLMGNQACQKAPPARVLARRVQLEQIVAPPITLPPSIGNQQFNFQFVANQQMQNVLNTTQSFSTANIDLGMTYTPAGLAAEITHDFNNCTSTTELQTAPEFISSQISMSGLTEITSKSNSCVINMPQAVVNGSINDFTLVGGGGLSLSLANTSVLPSLNFTFQSYTLQVEMTAKKPLDQGGFTFVSAIKNAKGYGGSLSETINLGSLALGPSGYYTTPLSTIVQNGLTGATKDLASAWSTQDPWYTTVLKACGTYIYVNGSTDLGLKTGDILAIKNVTYIWDGPVCDSTSLGDVPDVNPVSYAQIVSVGDNIAAAQILKGNSTYPQQNDTVYAGARVYMHQTLEALQSVQAATKAGTATGVCQLPVGTCTGK